MDPLTMMALAKGGSTVANYAMRRFGKQPKAFDDTEQGKRLGQTAQFGIYNPSVRNKILGQVGKTTGNVVQNAKVGMKGNMIGAGMEGSIAGQGAMAALDTSRVDKMGDVATNLETQNEMSKVNASNQYAQAKDAYTERKRQMDNTNNENLVGGLISAAGNYAMGKVQQGAMENLDVNDPASVQGYVTGQPDFGVALSTVKGMQGLADKDKVIRLTKAYATDNMGADEFAASLVQAGLTYDQIMMIDNAIDAEKAK